MKLAKYIIFEDSNGLKHPVIFPSEWEFNHYDVARRFSLKPVNAGFVKVIDGQVITNGCFISLNLSSGDGDSRIIQQMLVYPLD